MSRWHNWILLGFASLFLTGCVIAVAPGDAVREGYGRDEEADRRENWQEREIRLDAVERVVMRSAHRLHVVQGERQGIRITGPASAVRGVRVQHGDGVLTIDDPVNLDIDFGSRGSWRYPHPVRIELTVQNLSALDLEGQGVVELARLSVDKLHITAGGRGEVIATAIRAGQLTITLSGHGEVRLDEVIAGRMELVLSDHGEVFADDLTTRDLGLRVNDHGRVTLAGVVDQQKVAVEDQADYYGRNLNSRDAEVRMRGPAHAHLWVEGELRQDVEQGGTLRFEGTPQITRAAEAALSAVFRG